MRPLKYWSTGIYNMSVTSFGVLLVLLLCILESCTAVTSVNCPSGNVNDGSTVTLTCTINPAKAMSWKRDTNLLANCDTFFCTVISSPSRYAFTTDSGGQTVNLTIAPVEPDDDSKEFQCETSTSSDSCILSVSSTTTASTTVQPGANGLTTGQKTATGLGIGIGVIIMAIVCSVVLPRMLKDKKRSDKERLDKEMLGKKGPDKEMLDKEMLDKEKLDKWRREFKLNHELEILTALEDSFVKDANDRKTLCVLVCVLEVSPTLDKNEQLSEPKKETLAGNLQSVLERILDATVTVNNHKYTVRLPRCSLTAFLNVIDLIRGDEWIECLRQMEKTLQNTHLRTQFEEDSFRTCVANFQDLWKRENTEGRLRDHTRDSHIGRKWQIPPIGT